MTRPTPLSRPAVSVILVVAAASIVVALAGGRVASGEEQQRKESPPVPAATTQPASPLGFVVKDIDGNDYDLSRHRGQVVMIVNVASKCGLTPQYAGLEKLYDTYKDSGFVVVGFPANNFGSQEPGTNEQIKTFCTSKYDVSFPMMSKISVKGDDQHPLYRLLTEKSASNAFAGDIGWNFTKFLVARDGQVVARFDSKTKPDDAKVTEAMEKALGAP